MSDSPNAAMDINIWDHAKHINIPMNGHYNLEPDRSYTLEELANMGNKLGLECKESLENYDPTNAYINTASSPEQQISQHILMACLRMHVMARCPQCRDEIRTNDFYAYHPNFSKKDQINSITPCLMNKANATPFTYGINVPSGRLVVANDMRGLVYANVEPFADDNEKNNRQKLKDYADAGLLYLYAHGGVSFFATNTDNSYILGSIPTPQWHDEDEINDFLNTLPPSHHPQDIAGLPLAEISCGLWAVCAMDGDQVDAALQAFHPSDAQDIRAELTTINVAPGYYQITLSSTSDITQGGTAILTRVDDGATRPKRTATTFSMAEAMTRFKTALHYNFHPFNVWNERVDWALGCPCPDSTGGMGDTCEDITPVACDIAPLNALFDINPNMFSLTGKKQLLMNPTSNIFAAIPRNIAPQAIACWIVGADTTMHAIERHPGSKDFPAFSRHQIAAIYRVYEIFRSTLWGAAVARGTTDTVLAHITELRELINK